MPAVHYRMLLTRLNEYFLKSGRTQIPRSALDISAATGLSPWTVRQALKYAEYQLFSPLPNPITVDEVRARLKAGGF